ncbi:MAG TPA: type II toxin-antitoxin system VapC family toxin [Sphingobium sp.]|nr:type II toxin-antitoxin system VapC family toxin [Sphingobium sp.]
MTQFVIDASAVAPLTFWDEAHRLSEEEQTLVVTASLWAPGHWPFEVANMLLVALRRGRITDADHVRALGLLADLSVQFDDESRDRAWSDAFDLAVADGLTLYDAAYLELARRTGSGLLTLDAPLAAAARARGIHTPLLS